MPSSLTRGRSFALDCSSRLRVSVSGTVRYGLALDSISWHLDYIRFHSAFLPVAVTAWLRSSFSRPLNTLPLGPGIPSPGRISPHASCPRNRRGYRIVNRFPIGCAFRPRLRGRLTPGRLPLPGKPQASGGRESHPSLVTHACILSSIPSSAPRGCAFSGIWNAPLPPAAMNRRPAASVRRLAQLHCLRAPARPVSCYALFQGMAASEPTSWLSAQAHLISHLAPFWDLCRRSGLFPSRL